MRMSHDRCPPLGLMAPAAIALALLAPPIHALQSEPMSPVFTYSTIETDGNASAVASRIVDVSTPVFDEAGATLYAVWTPVAFPDSAPFLGLTPAQLVLMVAWPDDQAEPSDLDSTLRAVDGVTDVGTRIMDPIYLADGLDVPTEAGFYVQREELYRPADVEGVVRLSTEAWTTYEPTFGIRVIALLRERGDADGVAHLLRIAWYRSYDHWTESRQFARDPESLRRFQARGQLQLEGSGTAIATDRLLR